MIELNKGICVGGPFDGMEESVLIYPGDYPDDSPPAEVCEVRRAFSINFPEGAIYRWDKKEKVWLYCGPMEQDGVEGEHRRLFRILGLKEKPPL
jgi:hypothetical protein